MPDCAADINVSNKAIYDLIDARKLKAKKFGPRCTRVSRAEWERFKAAAPETDAEPAPAA